MLRAEFGEFGFRDRPIVSIVVASYMFFTAICTAALPFADLLSKFRSVVLFVPAIPCHNAAPMPESVPPRNPSLRSTLLACVAFLALSSLWLLIALRFSQTGWDFTQFYIAAHLPVSSLYDHTTFAAVGRKLLEPMGIAYYPPFVRPALFALALKPLALFSYWSAFWLWAAIGLAAYLAALLILFRWLALPRNLLPAFALFSPSLFGIVTGQDANVYLIVLLAALLLIAGGSEIAAGLLLALCVYKFNLLLFVPFVLLFKARWKSLFAFLLGSAAVAIFSALLAPPSQYLALLRSIPQLTIGFIPGALRGVSIRTGHELLYFPFAAVAAAFCLYLIWKLPLVEAFCVAVIAALLLGYHVTWYDCALLVLPICVAWRNAGSKTRASLLALLVLPFLWILGKEVFQVIAETIILFPFARMAFVAPTTPRGPGVRFPCRLSDGGFKVLGRHAFSKLPQVRLIHRVLETLTCQST